MNLQSTKNLLDKLKTDVVEINPSDYSDIENYHCNLLKFGRKNCVLITNDKTLFSFFIYGLTSDDFKHFEDSFSQPVFKILIELGFEQYQFEKVLDSLQNIKYSKTSNRKVISSMNNMKLMIDGFLEYGDDIMEINRKLNNIPYKYIGYEYSIRLFKELLNDSDTTKQHPQNFSSVNNIDWDGK